MGWPHQHRRCETHSSVDYIVKLSSLNDLQGSPSFRRLNAGLFDAVRPVPSAVAQPGGRGEPAPADAPQGGRKTRVVVSLVSLRKRILDDDNDVGAKKHLRDAIAASLGLDDGDKRFTWQYSQQPTTGREGIIVHIEVI